MLWEITNKMNIKQENERFNEAKVHTWEKSAGEFRLISSKDVWLVGFCSWVKSQRCGTDVSSLFPPSRQGAWFPTFFYLVFLELSWHQVPDASYSICTADGIIMILEFSKGQGFAKDASKLEMTTFVLSPLLGLKQGEIWRKEKFQTHILGVRGLSWAIYPASSVWLWNI